MISKDLLSRAKLLVQKNHNNVATRKEITMDQYYYVGIDIHKKIIAYCIKRADGSIESEGTIEATRKALQQWVEKLPKPWIGAMEATIFTGWIYDFLNPYACELQVGNPLMMRAITMAKKKNDKLDARTITDLESILILNMDACTSKSDKAEDEMKQSDIVVSLFLPADQNPTKTVQPAVRAFHNPATCLPPSIIAQLRRLNTSGHDMRCIVKLIKKLSDLIKIIGLVQTHVLALIRSRLRTLYGQSLKRWPGQFHVMSVGCIHSTADGDASAITQHRALNAVFAPIGRICARFFPHQAGLLSWHHPCSATSSQCHADRRTPKALSAKTVRKPRPAAIPGIVSALLNLSICRLRQETSTDSLFLKQTGYRSSPSGTAPASCRHRVGEGSPARAKAALSCSTAHQKFSIGSFLLSSSPSFGIIASERISEHYMNPLLILG
jgi:hypothetical protein